MSDKSLKAQLLRVRAPAPARKTTATPRAPAHLEAVERGMWRELTAEFTFDDAASRALLRAALEAHQRARRCRETVERDGEVFRDRFGQLRPHPLLSAERDARAAFLAAMRTLNLDLGAAS